MTKQNNNESVYYYHLNGLKGIACVLLMLGHYVSIYRFSENFIPKLGLYVFLEKIHLSFLADASYWLCFFCVISGYLVCKSRINNIKDLLFKSISRFLRLAIPVLSSHIIIYLLFVLVGFHCGETKILFESNWFQKYYSESISIFDVLLSPIKVLVIGDCKFNAPYWVLRMMYISSVIIYTLKLLYNQMRGVKESVKFSLLIIIALLSYNVSPIITACMIGMIVSLYENSNLFSSPVFSYWLMIVAMMLIIMPYDLLASIFFAIVVARLPHTHLLCTLFASKPFQFLGKISWGIYSFHWPIICSFGAAILLQLSEKYALPVAYYIAFIPVVIIVIMISVIYLFSFNKLDSYFLKCAKLRLRQLLNMSNRMSR